jgi:hypothetical protein
MTPVPFELPLRASEAAAVADLLFQQIEGRPLTPDQRGRLAGRLSSLSTPSIAIHSLSLSADPIHPSTYYLAVDGLSQGITPLLLRIGVSSAPGTALFPKSLMIGRMRPGGQREIVISAVPFGPNDADAVRTFAEQVDKAFLPRALGAQTVLTVRCEHPATEAAPVLDALRDRLPRGWQAALEVEPDGYWPAVWAAIRTGLREGYGLGTVIDCQAADALPRVEAAALFTRYRLVNGGSAAPGVIDHVRRVKAGVTAPHPRVADFELEAASLAGLPGLLLEWKASGRGVQSVSCASAAFEDLVKTAHAVGVQPVVCGGAPVPAGSRVSVFWPSAASYLASST